MPVRVSLDRFLASKNLSTYRLAKATLGRAAQGSIYAMARGEQVKRVDLETLSEIIQALERLTGQPVGVADILEIVPISEEESLAQFRVENLKALNLHLEELEREVSPEQLKIFNEGHLNPGIPVAFDPKRGVWLEGEEALAFRAS